MKRFVYKNDHFGQRVSDTKTGRWMSVDLVREMAAVIPAPTAKFQWYVSDPGRRSWFGDDEMAARTYLLLMREAFHLRAGVNLFLGRDIPPACISTLSNTQL